MKFNIIILIMLFLTQLNDLKSQYSQIPRSLYAINSLDLNNEKDTILVSNKIYFYNYFYEIINRTTFSDRVMLNDSIWISESFFNRNLVQSKDAVVFLDNNFNLNIITSKRKIVKYHFNPGFKIIGQDEYSIYFSSGPLVNVFEGDTLIPNSLLMLENGQLRVIKLKGLGRIKNLGIGDNSISYSSECLFISKNFQIFKNSDSDLNEKGELVQVVFKGKKRYRAKMLNHQINFRTVFEHENCLYIFNEKHKKIYQFKHGNISEYISLNDSIKNHLYISDFLYINGKFLILLYSTQLYSDPLTRIFCVNLKTNETQIFLIKMK